MADSASLPLTLRCGGVAPVEAACDGELLLRYVCAPKTDPIESPKPYFHPLRTLRGNVVTIFRPTDHPWHHGLAMTSANLSGQNFWGGPTYVDGKGYIELPNRGRIEHREWLEQRCDGARVSVGETLEWISSEGAKWVAEERRFAVSVPNRDAGWWALDLGFRFRNVRGEKLSFGSPTTAGRPQAGYGGLFWRGPRSFLSGSAIAGGGLDGPAIMGQRAPWLAFRGRHDGTLEHSTLVLLDHPSNLRHPTQWFVRNEGYSGACCAFMFDKEYPLAPDEEFRLNYRVIVSDGTWEAGPCQEAWNAYSKLPALV